MLAILIEFCKSSNFAPSVPTNLFQFYKHSSSIEKFITLISNLFKIPFETISSQFETTTSIWPFKRFWMYSNHFRSFGIFWKFKRFQWYFGQFGAFGHISIILEAFEGYFCHFGGLWCISFIFLKFQGYFCHFGDLWCISFIFFFNF